jgi:hypothetical protein
MVVGEEASSAAYYRDQEAGIRTMTAKRPEKYACKERKIKQTVGSLP